MGATESKGIPENERTECCARSSDTGLQSGTPWVQSHIGGSNELFAQARAGRPAFGGNAGIGTRRWGWHRSAHKDEDSPRPHTPDPDESELQLLRENVLSHLTPRSKTMPTPASCSDCCQRGAVAQAEARRVLQIARAERKKAHAVPVHPVEALDTSAIYNILYFACRANLGEPVQATKQFSRQSNQQNDSYVRSAPESRSVVATFTQLKKDLTEEHAHRRLDNLARANEIIEENKLGAIMDASECSGNVWRLRRMGCKQSLVKVDLEVRQSITPISCEKRASCSLSPSGHIELKKKLSDEQKDEFKAQYERVAENLWENKGAGKILARRAKEDYWNSEKEARCELEKLAQQCFQKREAEHGNTPPINKTNKSDEKFKEIERKIVGQFGKESELFRYAQLVKRIEIDSPTPATPRGLMTPRGLYLDERVRNEGIKKRAAPQTPRSLVFVAENFVQKN